jgi:hypothetical protein
MLSLLVRIRHQAVHLVVLILSIFSAPATARPAENSTEPTTTAELCQTFRLSDRENHCDSNRPLSKPFLPWELSWVRRS